MHKVEIKHETNLLTLQVCKACLVQWDFKETKALRVKLEKTERLDHRVQRCKLSYFAFVTIIFFRSTWSKGRQWSSRKSWYDYLL